MNNTINGRTPETIKKRVGCWNAFRQRKCPAAKDIAFKEPGACKNCTLQVPNYTVEQAMVDILEYAEQLERERDEARNDLDTINYANTELHSAYEAMKRERDAAVEDMTELMQLAQFCRHCKHLTEDGECTFDFAANKDEPWCWQWRGVQQEVE